MNILLKISRVAILVRSGYLDCITLFLDAPTAYPHHPDEPPNLNTDAPHGQGLAWVMGVFGLSRDQIDVTELPGPVRGHFSRGESTAPSKGSRKVAKAVKAR